MRTYGSALVLAVLLVVACDRGPEDPDITGLQITTTTTGLDLDADGYTVTVDDRPPQAMSANQILTVGDLSPRSHAVALKEIATNCQVEGETSLVVVVSHGRVTPVGFAVVCVATTGNVEVAAATSGLDQPPGYMVQVDDGGPMAVPANGIGSLSGISGGDHLLTLSDVAANCTVASGNSRQITVTVGGITRDTVRIRFEVSCVAATGVIEVTTATSGVDPDPNGYELRFDDRAPVTVYVNGIAYLAGVGGGDRVLTLGDVAPNCTVAGSSQRSVHITIGGLRRDTVRTTFQAACVRTDKIAFSRGAWGRSSITVAYADGSNAVALTVGELPAWSPDGTQLVFTRWDCDDPDSWYYGCLRAGLSVTNADGTGRTDLATHPSDTDAAWHPHGSTIAFTRQRNGRGALYLMNADGSNQTPIMSADLVHDASQPAWSPHGARIAFTCQVVPGWQDICLVNADGTGLVRLTSDAWRDHSPTWSPDGTRIAFTTNREVTVTHIAVMSTDGSAITRVAAGYHRAAWSRDGSKLVFSGVACDEIDCYLTGLSAVNADGTGLVQLTTDVSDYAPAWRP